MEDGGDKADLFKEGKRREQSELVAQRYPKGDQNVSSTISKIIDFKTQVRQKQIFKNVFNKPTIGYIKTKDLIELQKLKNDLFPDYDDLERQIRNIEDNLKGRSRF